MNVEESSNVTFDETPLPTKTSPLEDDDLVKEEAIEVNKTRPLESRPYIMFSVCLCARFQEDPKISHLEVVKRIFQYVKGTMHLGLWYTKGPDIETVFLKKQTTLATSTTEAEYVSAGKACQQVLWMKQALIDYGISLDDIPIMFDNKGAIDLSKNPVQHSRTKHIEIHHHFLPDNVQKGNISIEKVSLEDNIAN
ncbi:hypothetical protein Tco_1564304, partial [Tanacetum coccineum]